MTGPKANRPIREDAKGALQTAAEEHKSVRRSPETPSPPELNWSDRFEAILKEKETCRRRWCSPSGRRG
ncbi:hypothetical protein NL676_037482 [Syzygium grande]|nr:hypothetical protein NL676_037482 [Syzygium grande]